ncbi:MAG: SH3 domain-containing protein [Chloroflexota bacterium]|nr:MAG: SH3 domain-containing protein [Chloroflexota bacterium]
MHLSKVLSLLVVIAALCFPLHLTSAQAGIEMVLQAYNGDVALYERASSSSAILAVIRKGDRFIWRADRIDAEGRQWFFVQFDKFFGWISPDDGVIDFADPSAISPLMDRSAVAIIEDSPRNLYAAPGRFNPVIASLPVGTAIKVTDAPVTIDLYTWWKVRVNSSGMEGWIADSVPIFRVTEPLRVYGYQVCDNFNLAVFGMTGWDSIVSVLPSLLDVGETVVCLASTKMDGGLSPIVVVLARNEARAQDSLRAFALRSGRWTPIFARYADAFARTDRLSLHNLSDDAFPTLIWNVRLDGTGSVLQNNLLRFNPATGLVESQSMGEFYKGFMQLNGRQMTFFQANYLPDEPNCCPSGVERYVFEWNGVTFAPVLYDVLPIPYAIQTARR